MSRISFFCFVSLSTLSLLNVGWIGSAQAQKVEFSECSKSSQRRVREILRWFRRHQADIVERVTDRDAAAFRGNSEKRLSDMLKKHVTRIQCSQANELCGPETPKLQLGDQLVSVPHNYPLTLCMNELLGDETLAGVIAHNIGHHILLNVDKATCEERCREPNLATLLTEAVVSLRQGEPFSLEWCLTACAPSRSDASSDLKPLPSGVTPRKDAGANPANEMPKEPSTGTGP